MTDRRFVLPSTQNCARVRAHKKKEKRTRRISVEHSDTTSVKGENRAFLHRVLTFFVEASPLGDEDVHVPPLQTETQKIAVYILDR